MSEPPIHLHDEADVLPEGAAPQHGFRGPPDVAAAAGLPLGLTVAISREAGARGTDVARRAGAKLGWQVYTQDLLEYICQQGTLRPDVLDPLPPAAAAWVEAQFARVGREVDLAGHPPLVDLARTVLALGAQGEAILLGRGAGCVLPAASTLNVRLVAPLEDRIAYLSQWLRLTEAEAAEHVRTRDQRRAEFLTTHFRRRPTDVYQYDLVLNTSRLGEDRCADLIVHAARAKASAWWGDAD